MKFWDWIKDSRQKHLDQYMEHLLEKESILDKISKDIEEQKEFMLGKDNLQIKQQILLPAMKKKWEAEAAKIDAQRCVIIRATPGLKYSLRSRKLELESIVADIRGKERNMFNDEILSKTNGKIEMIDEFIDVIDKHGVL